MGRSCDRPKANWVINFFSKKTCQKTEYRKIFVPIKEPLLLAGTLRLYLKLVSGLASHHSPFKLLKRTKQNLKSMFM